MTNKQAAIWFGILVTGVVIAAYYKHSKQDIDIIMNDPSIEDKAGATLDLLFSTANFMRFLGLA